MKTNAERQANFRKNRVTLTLAESLELLTLIRDKGLVEFAHDNDDFSSVLRKLRAAESNYLESSE